MGDNASLSNIDSVKKEYGTDNFANDLRKVYGDLSKLTEASIAESNKQVVTKIKEIRKDYILTDVQIVAAYKII